MLVVVGLVSLVMGGFSWTREKTVIDLGPIEATARERETLPIPPIVGGLILAAGVVLLVVKPASHDHYPIRSSRDVRVHRRFCGAILPAPATLSA